MYGALFDKLRIVIRTTKPHLCKKSVIYCQPARINLPSVPFTKGILGASISIHASRDEEHKINGNRDNLDCWLFLYETDESSLATTYCDDKVRPLRTTERCLVVDFRSLRRKYASMF